VVRVGKLRTELVDFIMYIPQPMIAVSSPAVRHTFYQTLYSVLCRLAAVVSNVHYIPPFGKSITP